jgi:glycosyltransferase involved in cell wall biosynthesis
VTFVPTAVAPAFFEVSAARNGMPRLIFVASWIDRKGTAELTAAWEELARRHPDIRLTVVGPGAPRDRVLAEFSRDTRTRVEVHETVGRTQLAELLASHHIFVLPSWFEGMPLSMLEAAAAGLPCVLCNVCGNVDFIRESDPTNDGGVLVPPHDAGALAAAIERLLSDPALRTQLGARARKRARLFTWAHTAEITEGAYRAVVTA